MTSKLTAHTITLAQYDSTDDRIPSLNHIPADITLTLPDVHDPTPSESIDVTDQTVYTADNIHTELKCSTLLKGSLKFRSVPGAGRWLSVPMTLAHHSLI